MAYCVYSPSNVPEGCLAEIRSKAPTVHTLATVEQTPMLGDVIDCERYSSMSKLLRVTAYVLRAVKVFDLHNQLIAQF